MKIPQNKQKEYMNPREHYKTVRPTGLKIVAWVILVLILIGVPFALKPMLTLHQSEVVQGTVISQVEYKISTGRGSKTAYKTTIQYKGRILHSNNMEYWKVSNKLGTPRGTVDLLITKKGTVEIKAVVEDYMTSAILYMLFCFLAYLAMEAVITWSRRGDTKQPLFSDARAIRFMEGPYDAGDWYETYPHLVKMINPDTGNIETNYIPPENETTQEMKERFQRTLDKYGVTNPKGEDHVPAKKESD